MTRSKQVRRRAPPQRAALKQAEKIWLATTLTLILFLVGTSQACILVPYFLYSLPSQNGKTLQKLVQLLVPFNVGAVGILWNYALCVRMDPGGVPPSYTPPLLEQESDGTGEGELRNGKKGTTPRANTPRHCKSCKSYKPPRAHHCRTCKRCVLRMDHHCPWIANCVGQRNYASFVRFLACVDVTCAMHLGLLIARTCDYWWLQVGGVWRAPSTFQMTFLVLNFAFCIPTFLLVGVFSLYHFWNLCTNTTTIEGWEKDKVERMINRGRIRDTDYPFDLGTLRNVTSILGRSPMLWCLPSATTGDGLSFDVSEGIDPIEQYDWPPRDPSKAERSRQYVDMSGSPFTNGDNFNPALRPTNKSTLRQRTKSRLPPWHADYSHDGQGVQKGEVEGEMDTAAEAGLDTGERCLTHITDDQRHDLPDEFGTNSASSSDEGHDEQRTGIRTHVRRGSEGYEVRPKRFDVAYAEQYEQGQEHVREDASGSDADSADVDASDDDAAWVWRQQQRQEERIRRQIQEDWRRQLRESRQNGQIDAFDPVASTQAGTRSIDGSAGIMLPSQIQQQRAAAALNGMPNAQGNGGAEVERADGASEKDG